MAQENVSTTITENNGLKARLTARNMSYIVLVLAILVSGYLSYLKIDTDTAAVCIESGPFDCGTVLNSAYSEINGIPIAWLGLGTDLLILTLLLLEDRIAFLRLYGIPLVFGVALFAFLFSVYLVYLQAFVIRAYCPWCLSHEALITILFGLSLWRFWKYLNAETPELQAQ